MINILETIVANKKLEVAAAKKQTSISELEKMPMFNRSTFSLSSFVCDTSKFGIIAEFKRKSPSRGVINDQAMVQEIAEAYAKYGASGISVLTDHEFFGGSLQDLVAANHFGVPLLRKDFMIDEYQIFEAKAFGADAILLIAACLTPAEVASMAKLARSLNLEVLLEIHQQEELEHICNEVNLVGVNNRNLKNFEVAIQNSLDLIKLIPRHLPAIAESGISQTETMVTLRNAGFKGFLIGENFMKSKDPAIAFADFIQKLKLG